MTVRAVISDDEPLALEKLRRFLAADHRVSVVGEAHDGFETVDLVERLGPDLLILDVQMPGLDGFEVIDALSGRRPRLVFVTAYDEYAIRAFEVGAIDYLLKPVDRTRFVTALDRALRGGHPQANLSRALSALDPERRYLRRFLIRDRGRVYVIPVGRVESIAAAGNYLKLHGPDGLHLVRGTMKRVEQRLDPARFARIHRSTIVNVEHVVRITVSSHGDQEVLLRSGATVLASRRYKARLRDALDR